MGGSSAHQKAMLGNLVASLIAAESIVTTEAKAKALRPVAEKCVTAARKGGLVAMKALARKLAGLYYRVLRYGLEYAEQGLQKTTPVMRKASGGSSSSWRPSKDSNSSPHPSHRQEK